MNLGKIWCLWEKTEGTELSKDRMRKQTLSAVASASDVPALPMAQQRGTRFDSSHHLSPHNRYSEWEAWHSGSQRVLLLFAPYALHSADSCTFWRIKATKSVTCIKEGLAPSREINGSQALLQQEGSMNTETRIEFIMVLSLNISEKPVPYTYADVLLL